MPVFNTSRYVSVAIESMLKQTYENFEFIIIDDCSEDESVAIIEDYQDPRIKLIKNEENLGISNTRNKGLRAAQGKYIAVFDSDDIAPANRLEKQVSFLEENPEFGLIGGAVQPIGEDGQHIGSAWDYPAPPEEVPVRLLFGNYFAQPAVMIRARVLADTEPYNPAFVTAGDYDLWVRLSRVTRVWNLPEVMLYYRMHGSGITRKTKRDISLGSIKKIIGSHLHYLEIEHTEEDLSIYLEITNNSYDKSFEAFVRRLKRGYLPDVYFSLLSSIGFANQKLKRFDQEALNRVLDEKKQLIEELYAKKYFTKHQTYNLKLLRQFFASPLRPARFLSFKEKSRFVLKCLLHYKAAQYLSEKER
jgi:glycosyltransferase involved in cell wall biosynthesis